MDHDATWYGSRPGLGPWQHCVRWDPAPPSQKGHSAATFVPCLLWPNGWMHQDTTWCGCRPLLRRHCVRWDPAPPRKGVQQPPSLFGPFYSGTFGHLSNCWALKLQTWCSSWCLNKCQSTEGSYQFRISDKIVWHYLHDYNVIAISVTYAEKLKTWCVVY